jgi:predicted nucleic acid-binding protein
LREPAVLDSTCLISLDRVGRLDLLPKLFDPIAAPPEVGREWGLSAPWLQIEPSSNPALVTALRLLAHRMGLKVIGTVGILVRAKRVGLLTWISPVLNELIEKGFRLSEDLKREALRLAGE